MSYSAFQPRRPIKRQDLLWEWNGVDTTQFDTPFIVTSTGPGSLVPEIDILVAPDFISPHAGGNILDLFKSGTAIAGDHWLVFPILQELPLSYEMSIFSSGGAGSNSINTGISFCIWGDFSTPGEPYGYLWCPSGCSARMDGSLIAATNSSPSTNPSNYLKGGQYRLVVEGRPESDYPRGSALFTGGAGAAYFSTVNRNAFTSGDGNWNVGSLPPAGWAGKAANRFGFCVKLFGTNDQRWRILSMRIFSRI